MVRGFKVGITLIINYIGEWCHYMDSNLCVCVCVCPF